MRRKEQRVEVSEPFQKLWQQFRTDLDKIATSYAMDTVAGFPVPADYAHYIPGGEEETSRAEATRKDSHASFWQEEAPSRKLYMRVRWYE